MQTKYLNAVAGKPPHYKNIAFVAKARYRLGMFWA